MSALRSSIVEKLIAGFALAFAFIIMASVFTPTGSSAGDRAGRHDDGTMHSTDPHEGLKSLGTLISGEYEVHIYSTDVGPRYTVYSRTDGEELATLITAEKVAQWYPDLPLTSIDFDAPTQLMMADPDDPI